MQIGDIQQFMRAQQIKVEQRQQEMKEIKKGIYQMQARIDSQSMETFMKECEKNDKKPVDAKTESEKTDSEKSGQSVIYGMRAVLSEKSTPENPLVPISQRGENAAKYIEQEKEFYRAFIEKLENLENSSMGETKANQIHSDEVTESEHSATEDSSEETMDYRKFLQEKIQELFEKIQNGDTEATYQIGPQSFTEKEWEKLLEKFDSVMEAFRELMRERQAKQEEKKVEQELTSATDGVVQDKSADGVTQKAVAPLYYPPSAAPDFKEEKTVLGTDINKAAIDNPISEKAINQLFEDMDEAEKATDDYTRTTFSSDGNNSQNSAEGENVRELSYGNGPGTRQAFKAGNVHNGIGFIFGYDKMIEGRENEDR